MKLYCKDGKRAFRRDERLLRGLVRSGVLATALLATTTAALSGQSAVTAFTDVAVVRVDMGDVVPAQTVIVQGDRIVAVGPASATAIPPSAARIDGRGRYLVPGLIDLNGYLPGPAEPHDVEDVLLLYLVRGVTTVRPREGHPSHAGLQRRLEGGSLSGPRLLPAPSEGAQPEALAPADVTLADLLQGGSGLLIPPDGPDLTSVTLQAARASGLGTELGQVREGYRADLLLLDRNPLVAPPPLGSVAGVMKDGVWAAQGELLHRIEDRAKELIVREYYRSIDDFGATQSFAACTGVSLQDCFGGDPQCVLYMHPPNVRRGSVCTHPAVREDRARLLERLALFGTAAPSSDWIIGQWVHFAWKDDDSSQAWRAASACQGSRWWCQALRGFALHQRAPGSGGAQLDSAWASAPPGTRVWSDPSRPAPTRRATVVRVGIYHIPDRGLHCHWADLTPLLSARADIGTPSGLPRSTVPLPQGTGALLADHQRSGCGWSGIEHRFWWLADPLWSVEGNARRDEHIVRHLLLRLYDELVTRTFQPPYYWEAWVADGVPNSWTRGVRCRGSCPVITSRGTQASSATRFGRPYLDGGYSFTPDSARFYDPVSSRAEDWEVAWDQGHERMIPRETWHNLEHQTAVLRRGDRLLVLAAARAPLLLPSYQGVRAALAMGRPSDLSVEVVPAQIDRFGAARASAEVEDDGWVASVEVLGEDWVGRARHGALAPALDEHGFGISAPILVDERLGGEGVGALLGAMLPSSSLAGQSQIGAYVEVYGVTADEPLRFTVSAHAMRLERSLLEQVASALRLRSRASSLEVSWMEGADPQDPGLLRRLLTVDLGGLENGEYELVVRVEREEGAVASATRPFRSRGGGR